MADYYPLLTRAVRNLPQNTPEARQAIFLRARDALERQLRSVTPRLTDADIVRELLSLEDVIKRIDREIDEEEAEAAASLRQTEAAISALPPTPPAETLPSPADEAEPAPKKEADTSGSRLEPRLPIAKRPVLPIREAALEPATSRFAESEPDSATQPVPGTGAVAPSQRVKLPDEAKTDGKRKRLALLAVGGLLAIIVMAMIALVNRERPDRYRAGATAENAQIAAAEAAKREGRLTGEPGPQPPSAPISQPEVAPSRPVTSVPIQAPVNPPPQQQAEAAPLAVASRAYMILESQDRTPTQYEGQAVWSFAPDPASRSPEKALRTALSFASGGIGVDISMARATDASLNASHVVSISFTPRADLAAVRDLSALEWREREGQAGQTLAGTLVPIQENFFMIGLDATPNGRRRNLDLLRSQRWLVFEILLANGRRGAFLVEKGSNGDKAISEALAAWE